MSNVEMMLCWIDEDPDNLIAVAALTDALMDERDMNRSEADRYAEKAVRTVRDARDLAEAARLLQPKQPWHYELTLDIRRAAFLTDSCPLVIVVVIGDMTPAASAAEPSPEVAGFWGVTVSVGAAWVIRHFRNNSSLCLQERMHRRPGRQRR